MATYTKEGYDKKFKKPVGIRQLIGAKKLVRCLGPKNEEHYFMSTGPHNRLCPRCQSAVSLLAHGIPNLYIIAVGKEHYHE